MRKKNIKIATFNLFNLVKPETHYYGNRKYSKSEYDKKIEWIAYQLKQINADIIAFQEIFHIEPLKEAIEKSGIYKDYELSFAKVNGELPRVGLLSRFPIVKEEVIEKYPEESIIEIPNEADKTTYKLPFKEFSRPVLRADIKVHNNLVISFYVVHLKSKRPELLESEDRDNPIHAAKGITRSLFIRAAEATALRTVLMETLLKKDNPVVVMGDVNDSGLSVSTQIISGVPPHRNLPIEIKKDLWDVLLYHVKDIQARRSYQDIYYTYIHNGHYENLDQIMVSQELVSENPNHVGKIGYISLLNDHLIDQTFTNDKAKPWHSDHGIVAVTIELLLDKIEKQ